MFFFSPLVFFYDDTCLMIMEIQINNDNLEFAVFLFCIGLIFYSVNILHCTMTTTIRY